MATIHYARLDEFWRKEQKYDFLDQRGHVGTVDWQVLAPDKHHLWLTEGMHDEFESFLPMGTKQAKAGKGNAIFLTYGRGVATSRDDWAFNFNHEYLAQNIKRMIGEYNDHVFRLSQLSSKPNIDDYVSYDNAKINWSRDLKLDLQRGRFAEFTESKIRKSIYRPFSKQYLFFDKILNEEVYQFPRFFPTTGTELENLVICVVNEAQIPFSSQITNHIPCLHYGGRQTQCFPFYTYAEDGSQRRENITDWALAQFQQRYSQSPITQSPITQLPITKSDIFHYVYALLHHPDYRAKYAANLRRELPRIPLVEDFWGFAQAGARLAALHVDYESQPEYRLDWIENPGQPLNWRVERMRLSKDKTSLVYNSFLTLAGIPPQVYDYKLGNRSALEWLVDQYQVSVDKRSGIRNDPNNPADPQAIVRLIGQVISVSVATVAIVNTLPPLAIFDQNF